MSRIVLFVALVALAACPALAARRLLAVTIDVNAPTGEGLYIGFVGKGDVQLAFGWNNKQLQDNAAGVSFSYEQKTRVVGVCEYEKTTGKTTQTKEKDYKRMAKVSSSVAYDLRIRTQITGFNLKALTDIVDQVLDENGSANDGNGVGNILPVLNAPCFAEGVQGVYIEVYNDASKSSAGVYASFNGGSAVLLPFSPPPPPPSPLDAAAP